MAAEEPRSTHAQQVRLSHIDFRVNFLGSVGRNDLTSRFGIKEAAATRDLADYKNRAPQNLIFDNLAKRYVRAETFTPLFQYSSGQVLAALANGFGEDFVVKNKALIACELPAQLNKPSIEIISVLSRAIHQKKVATIEYMSVASGASSREIVPFSFVNTGLRWHVRAFDRKRGHFCDFVMTRILNARISDGSKIEENETRENDIQWNRIVELEIKAHPRLSHPKTIELDYGMQDGILKINVRAAVAGYLLRLWNVDCSPNHELSGEEIHLWLSNSVTLYGVENLFLAPGYSGDKS